MSLKVMSLYSLAVNRMIIKTKNDIKFFSKDKQLIQKFIPKTTYLLFWGKVEQRKLLSVEKRN